MEKVSKDLVSIVIPIYNVEKYLKKCLDTVLSQTYNNIEIILVDDGSTDNSPQICDEYRKKDERVKVIHKKNAGVSAARNDGIKNSTGEWITFVDADDWVEKNYVSSMYRAAISEETQYISCGYNRVYNDRIESINNDNKILVFDKETYIKKLLNVQNGYGFCHMKLINKDILDNVTFNKKLKVGEDALFNVEICKKLDKAVIINKSLYNYRFNDESVVRKYDLNYINKYQKSMEVMKDYILDNYYNNITLVKSLHNYISYHVMLIAVNYCYHPNNKNKYKSLKKICNIPIFKESIKKSTLDDLSLTRKITLATLKLRLYVITALICRIRQLQFRK